MILDLVAARGGGKTICPSEAARHLAAAAGSPDDWRRLLKPVRRVAQALARDGRIAILRKGKPIAPEDLHGLVRLGSLSEV